MNIFNRTHFYIFIWAVFIFTCTELGPYFSNDFRYMLIQGTTDFVGSIGDIFVSQWRHYFEWGGRTPNHLLAQFLLYIGKPWSAIATGLCFAALVVVIYCHGYCCSVSRALKNLKFWPVVFIIFSLWLCLRVFGEVVFMLVSSCNYFYSTTFILYFLLPYRLSFSDFYPKRAVSFSAVMFLSGIIAGWCNENTGFAVALGIGAVCLFHLLKRKLSLWQLLGAAGFATGYLLLVFSPGNAVRLEYMNSGPDYSYLKHTLDTLKIFGISLVTQIPLLLSFFYLTIKVKKSGFNIEDKKSWNGAWWLFSIGFLSLAIMIASPNFPARSAAPFTMFAIAATVAMYRVYEKNSQEKLLSGSYFKCLAVIGTVYCIATMSNTLMAYYQMHQDSMEREAEIRSQLKAGVENLVVQPYKVQATKYVYASDVRASKKYWTNNILEYFYKVKSIRRACDEEKRDIEKDFIFFTSVGKPICNLDRGDPYDPEDKVNREYIKQHPDATEHLEFRSEEQRQAYLKDMQNVFSEEQVKKILELKLNPDPGYDPIAISSGQNKSQKN